jgi:hypothetical protein
MDKIKLALSYIVRQVLALVMGVLLIAGTILGSALVGVLVAFFCLVIGVCFALFVCFAPLIGLTATGALKRATEELKEAAEKASNVTPIRK